VRALFKKLLRDLSRLSGQLITIALVVACGVASFVTLQANYDSLLRSRDAYYAKYRFAELFAHLERAPASFADRLETLPGVAQVETRVTERVMVPMPAMPRPATGTLVSLPDAGEPALNRVHLVAGRPLDPDASGEVLLVESFAKAHGLVPGDRIDVVIDGAMRTLDIVGLAMSPEYVLVLPAGEMVINPKRVAILWMSESQAAAAVDMAGAFNDVSIRLQPGANSTAVKSLVDEMLRPYGSIGAITRDRQISNMVLEGELAQLEGMATVVPFIFLGVAAFLLNVVLARLANLQRSQIATLKAVGYTDFSIALHYLEMVMVVVLVGSVVGLGVGAWLGEAMLDFYTGLFFRFPNAEFTMRVDTALVAIGVSLLSAGLGVLSAVMRVARMPPAEAMRPPAPARYTKTPLERIGLFRFLGPATRMILREVQRRPLRVLLSSVGIAAAIGIVVVGQFMDDSIGLLMDERIPRAMREDLRVSLMGPRPERTVRELEHMDGVLRAEGLRTVGVRFKNGHRWRDVPVNGYPDDITLAQLVEGDGNIVPHPRGRGMLVTRKLAELLDVRVGDTVELEMLEGDRPTRRIQVDGLVDEAFGLQGHMDLGALHRLMREGDVVNTVLLQVDPAQRVAITEKLKEQPWVLSVSSPRDFRTQFEEQSGAMMDVYALIITIFAVIIAVGVIYNNTRVALSQRNRDLASLRVLGYTQAEIAAILFGEQAIQLVLAMPIGALLGNAMVEGIMSTTDPETYRMPVLISYKSYIFSFLVATAAALISALLVRRKLASLDLIEVLKTRE